jgi:predicted DNA-binding antitoxin AbrB/MazE fold protein
MDQEVAHFFGGPTMTQVEAVYQDGVFKPVQEVALPQNQRVRLTVESVPRNEILQWLDEMRKIQQPILDRVGFLPDSTPEIAEDRRR